MLLYAGGTIKCITLMSALMHDNLLEKLLLEFQLLCFFLSVCFCLIHVRCSMSILISIFSVNFLFCTKCGSDYFVCMFGIDHVHNTFRQFFCCTHSMAASFSISYFFWTNQTVCAAHAQPNIDNKKKKHLCKSTNFACTQIIRTTQNILFIDHDWSCNLSCALCCQLYFIFMCSRLEIEL